MDRFKGKFKQEHIFHGKIALVSGEDFPLNQSHPYTMIKIPSDILSGMQNKQHNGYLGFSQNGGYSKIAF